MKTDSSSRARIRNAADRGQGMLEFVFATLLALSIILGVIQIALLFNAHHMVKLAAFNAARAAIVARDPDKPEDPVTLKEMHDKAQLAAFITLLPVIPDLHGILPASLANAPSSIQNILGLGAGNAGTGAAGMFGALGLRAFFIAMEFAAIEVKFVLAEGNADSVEIDGARIAAMDPDHDHIEFDDRSKAELNLLKVVVSWNYPLVVPFANRIMAAAANPLAYAAAFAIAHPDFLARNPLVLFRLLTGDQDAVPVWGMGLEFETAINRATGGDPVFGEILRRIAYRIPIKETYMMRMQWDRKP
jgi:hypothetical protein